MATTTLSIAKLLTFPSNSNGLSNYKPSIYSEEATDRTVSRSPPRKTARLEGDKDNTSSRSRNKGKQREESTLVGRSVPVFTVEPSIETGLSEDYLNSLPPQIHADIHTLLKLPESGIPTNIGSPDIIYETVFQNSKILVQKSGKGQWVYDKLLFELKEVAAGLQKRLYVVSLRDEEAMNWLEDCVAAAEWFDGNVRLLETMLTYLDRVFIPRKPDLQSVRDLAVGRFKALVLENASVAANIQKAIKVWICEERNIHAAQGHRRTISSLIRILTDYQLFSAYFLQPYVEETRVYFTAESERLSTELQENPRNFLINCQERLDEEKTRNSDVLEAYELDWPVIISTTEKALLHGKLSWLSIEVTEAVNRRSESDLERIYKLFARVDGLSLLCSAFKSHIHTCVAAIVRDKEHDDELVSRLLDFKTFTDTVCQKSFKGDRNFRSAATDAFMTGFRVRKNKPAEMIAKKLDYELRRGQKEASTEEFLGKLNSVLSLYRFTPDKDVFRTFYHRAFAKRLLLQRSASNDIELDMLRTLQTTYDPEFNMGKDMFGDLDFSQQLMKEFHERAVGQGRAQMLNVMVLKRSVWPFIPKKEQGALLPSDMQADLNKFVAFYNTKHQGRKLDFDHSLGTVQLKARFKGGDKELQVSLHQALILLLFNEQDEVGFADIKQNTRIGEDAELRRTLQSLACAQKKVLKKRPVGRDINDGDVFYFNADFTDPRARVHINQIQAKEDPEEDRKTQSAIESDRKSFLEAAIVRIMKAKKTMKHQALIAAVIDTMKAHFVPEVSMIKNRFDYLIEAEYIRRDEEEKNVYVYVA